jgi:IS30 family transposase
MSDTQLTEVERYQIQSFLKAGYTQKAIAEKLGRDPGTISRELGRNTKLTRISAPAGASSCC